MDCSSLPKKMVHDRFNTNVSVSRENRTAITNPRYQVSAAQLRELEVPGRWLGFRLSQKDFENVPILDLQYDGKILTVKEKKEINPEPEKIDPLEEFVNGFLMKPTGAEYKTCASYESRLTWKHNGLLTWENPTGCHEGGMVWKLDRMRSTTNELRWVSEEVEGGRFLGVSVFFWHRVPDLPRHDNNVLWWHGIAKMLQNFLDGQDRHDNEKVSKISGSSRACNAAEKLQSHHGLPNLLGSRRVHMKAGIDVKWADPKNKVCVKADQ